MAEKKKTSKKTPAKKAAKAKKTTAKKTTVKKSAAKPAAKAVKELKEKKVVKSTKPSGKNYLQTIGRRKRSIAQVRLYKSGKGEIIVNEKPYIEYFPILDLQKTVKEPLVAAGQTDKVDLSVKVQGGGTRGQAEATRLGIARALIELNPTVKGNLKKNGFLTRDPRKKERKKPGLKGARRAPQWSKR